MLLVTKKRRYIVIEGFTQGTTYKIAYWHPSKVNLKNSIDSIFQVIDTTLSIYNNESLISKINNTEDTFIIKNYHLKKLIELSFRINKITNGVYDITLKPLVDAYGFGSGTEIKKLDSITIDSLMKFVGMEKIFLKDSLFVKQNKNIKIDLNAIAQGYTCDLIANFFDNMNIKDYMIEVGGEIRTKGVNPKNKKWVIGIDRPDESNMIPGQDLKSVVYISNISLATSGNYRKYMIKEGKKFSHIINPYTGFPAQSDILSVTVFHDTCSIADAMATAFVVMGYNKTINFLNTYPNIQAYIIYVDSSNNIKTWMSEKLKKQLIELQ